MHPWYCGCTGWTTDNAGFDSREGHDSVPNSKATRPVLAITQPLVHSVPGASYSGEKGWGRQVDHASQQNVELQNARSHTFTPHYAFMW